MQRLCSSRADSERRRPPLSYQHIGRISIDARRQGRRIMNLVNCIIKTAYVIQVFVWSYGKTNWRTMYPAGKRCDFVKTVRARGIDLIWIHRVDPVLTIIQEEILTYVRTRETVRRITRTKC